MQLEAAVLRRILQGASASTEWWLLQLLHRDRVHSANCAEDRRFHGAVLGRSSTCPLVCKRQAVVQTVQYSDRVVDVPAVHRQGVDVLVILQ